MATTYLFIGKFSRQAAEPRLVQQGTLWGAQVSCNLKLAVVITSAGDLVVESYVSVRCCSRNSLNI